MAILRSWRPTRTNSDRVLDFAPNMSRGFEIFVDSSWAARFSCSGAIYMLYGCLIHWFSKTQKSVALSSAEAEFFGAMMAARDGVFARDLLFSQKLILFADDAEMNCFQHTLLQRGGDVCCTVLVYLIVPCTVTTYPCCIHFA